MTELDETSEAAPAKAGEPVELEPRDRDWSANPHGIYVPLPAEERHRADGPSKGLLARILSALRPA